LIAFSNLVALALDFFAFIFAWGATLVLLYALLGVSCADASRKALSLLGFADFSLMTGIGLYVTVSGTTLMPQAGGIVLDSPLIWFAFIFMLIGALAKSGCGPLHTWIPQAAERASIPVMAILPASLDKLLGIYLLARICIDFFILNTAAMVILLIIGSLTIIFAVLMALIQHDLRKLLSFHAISQVGYMVLGFGTGTAIGILGGLFHMINNAIYKTGLFLSGGAVAEEKKTFELEKLGRLAAYMPLTFISALVFSLSISGVPPFNGFTSKWMLYQGTLEGLLNSTNRFLAAVYIFALVSAMFGSALTLASFIKFIHSIFLGQSLDSERNKPKEAPFNMVFPILILAGLCLILGVLPKLFLKNFIQPWQIAKEVTFFGTWNSIFVFTFLCLGLLLGIILWSLTKNRSVTKTDDYYIGAETQALETNFPATEFYRTIEEMPLMKRIYALIKKESLDLYNLLTGALNVLAYIIFVFIDRLIYILTNFVGYLILGFSWFFRILHSGVLDLYLAWGLFGLMVLFLIFIVK
jgi:formate hydrogenlyase subunit 3/multisubunit Na+/H+ antiporter MnhD subunit